MRWDVSNLLINQGKRPNSIYAQIGMPSTVTKGLPKIRTLELELFQKKLLSGNPLSQRRDCLPHYHVLPWHLNIDLKSIPRISALKKITIHKIHTKIWLSNQNGSIVSQCLGDFFSSFPLVLLVAPVYFNDLESTQVLGGGACCWMETN